MGGPYGRTIEYWRTPRIWEDPMGGPYGRTLWEGPTDLGRPYGKILWEDPMGGPYGRTPQIWEDPMGEP